LIVLSEVEGEGLRASFAVDTDESGGRLEHELLVGDDDAPASGRMVRGGKNAREERNDALEVVLLGTGLNVASDTTDVGVVYGQKDNQHRDARETRSSETHRERHLPRRERRKERVGSCVEWK
jgi:hypothetical protein